jgi:hypothetical protein
VVRADSILDTGDDSRSSDRWKSVAGTLMLSVSLGGALAAGHLSGRNFRARFARALTSPKSTTHDWPVTSPNGNDMAYFTNVLE